MLGRCIIECLVSKFLIGGWTGERWERGERIVLMSEIVVNASQGN